MGTVSGRPNIHVLYIPVLVIEPKLHQALREKKAERIRHSLVWGCAGKMSKTLHRSG